MLCLQEVERTDLDSFLGFDMSRYAKIESDLRTFRENCEFCGFFTDVCGASASSKEMRNRF